MKSLVAQAMDEGAFGLSCGLAYIPNAYMSTEELIDLAEVAASYGGSYISHLRSGLDGLEEGIRIAREAGLPLIIHHLNSTAARNIEKFAKLIEEARKENLEISANVYPYIAGLTYLRALLPGWAQEGGTEAVLKRLGDPTLRKRILSEMEKGGSAIAPERWEGVLVDGRPLTDIGKERGVPPTVAALELLQERDGGGFMILFGNTEEHLSIALSQTWASIGSDGSAHEIGMKGVLGKAHPRFFGTHPRVLGRYVREKNLFSLEEAVRKMTSLPAEQLGLVDRGTLRVGMKADIVVFDPNEIRDLATFEEPEQYAVGMEWVLVNGVPVIEQGEPTGELPGQVIYGPGRP
jgi:N-acyl-D-aspartate/D-glutamate deacylase